MLQPQKKEKTPTINIETFIGKRIIVTFPPAITEIIFEVVKPALADPEKWKLAPNAPIVSLLMAKTPGEEFDFTVGRGLSATKFRYKLIKVIG